MTVHDDYRTALLDETVGPHVEEHARTCDSCHDFALRVARVVTAAPSLAPPGPPPGLADRVVAQLPAPVVPLRQRRFPLLPTALTTAAALVLGAVVLLDSREPDPRAVLLAAASNTEAAGTARIEVDAQAELVVQGSAGQPPSVADVPTELQAFALSQWDALMRQFEVQMDAFLDQFDAALDGMWGAPPAAPSGQPSAPEHLVLDVVVNAAGEVAFDESLRVAGEVSASAGSASAVAGFALAADGAGPRVEVDGEWVALPPSSAPLGAVLVHPDVALRALRASDEVEQLDGNRYRFEVEAAALGLAGEGRWDAEAELDSDNRLQALTLVSSDAATDDELRWQTRTSMRFAELGVPVEVSAPAPAHTAPPVDASSRLVYPFGPALSVAVAPTR